MDALRRGSSDAYVTLGVYTCPWRGRLDSYEYYHCPIAAYSLNAAVRYDVLYEISTSNDTSQFAMLRSPKQMRIKT
ncbi:hypothetical protein PG997_007172 [Apiospora hydei]|uniref:Uncharacterized protein n=1 Tax=Apiospora hydei TaxID=1337664 RepID=A0ABR1WQT3_9PEZI